MWGVGVRVVPPARRTGRRGRVTDCEACSSHVGEHTCESELDVLFVPADMFLRIPQIGHPTTMTFSTLAANLAKPAVGDRKDVAGAYSPALYRENVRRKSHLLHVWCLVIDIDDGNVDPARLAELFSKRSAVVHSTFSSTPEARRSRIIVELAKPIDVATYDKLHTHYRAALLRQKITADLGAKDASRLSYIPVVRPGVEQVTFKVGGAPLDGAGLVAKLPPEPKRPPPVVIPPDHRDKYVQGALRKAADAIASTSDGLRHYTLAREAWGLARLDLSEHEIEAALLPAFVAVAGEGRRAEGLRTIRGQVADRNGKT